MADDVRQIGGKLATDIDRADEKLDARLSAVEKCVLPNGRPGLEDRMKEHVRSEIESLRSYVDKRDDHKERNSSQEIHDVKTMITYRLDEQDKRQDKAEVKADERHNENIKKFDGITTKLSYAAGGVGVITILVQHFWK